MGQPNRLIKKGRLNSPVVEQTPVVWKGRLVLAETWQSHYWDKPPGRCPHVRVRDEETDSVLCRLMDGFGMSSAFVWEDTFYVFAARWMPERPNYNNVYMSKSADLRSWSEPELVVEQEHGENVFNSSVCWDGRRFVMAYETNMKPQFTLKFAESRDLEHWTKIPDAIYGTDRYTACPALRHAGGYYYMLYLEYLKPRWWFETRLTRSTDLHTWEDAPRRPVIAPNPDNKAWPDCPDQQNECNASDPDLVEWQGKTRVYFTGGNQHWAGDLQYAKFDGPMQEFFESYYD